MTGRTKKLVETLPVIAFLGYWLYSCLICALLSGDPRLLRIWFFSSPVLIAAGLALKKILSAPEENQ